MSETEAAEFFSSIKDLHLGHQRACVKDAMRLEPEITNTKAFVKWGVQFTEELR